MSLLWTPDFTKAGKMTQEQTAGEFQVPTLACMELRLLSTRPFQFFTDVNFRMY